MGKTILTALAVLVAALPASAATSFGPETLVHQKCTGCHPRQADGHISRIEEIRTTPEEWTVIVDRMRRVHRMPLARAEMDRLLKELCASQLIDPEDQARVSYLSLFHNAQVVEAPAGAEEAPLFATCVRCHTAGKIRSYRMTEASWGKVRDFHLYMDPAIVFQMREMHWADAATSVLQQLAAQQPYGAARTAAPATLEGRWTIVGYEPGKGTYRGEAVVSGGADGEYTLSGQLRYADKTEEAFRGEATLYGGYALRTRTRHGSVETRGAYILAGAELRGENHFPAPRFRTSTQTWARTDAGPRVLRVTPGFLLAGEPTTLTIEGVDLPAVSADDVSFGGGVRVLAARRVGTDAIEVHAVSRAGDVAQAPISVKGLDAGAVTLAPRIDHIAVTPAVGRARLFGGPSFPAEGVQFEAIAYAKRGADPGVDVVLGPVPATFVLAEEVTRDGDDDLRFVGTIARNGSYVPAGDYAPLETRAYSTEGSGLVKAVATYRRRASTYRAEAQLAVTVPDFVPRIR